MKTFTTLFVLICCLLSLHAEIINVPGEAISIQAGINSASTGDTVLVAEGTYLENISFKGKAITLASQFILEGDTSHISKTIIDGSQPSDPDSASVVFFRDGEDSTSVLSGLTITGGAGTLYFHPTLGFRRVGGGIFIMDGSAGKIEHNIIRNNRMEYPIQMWGGGICVMFGPDGDTDFDKSVIIQNNTITRNHIISSWGQEASSGGGIKVGTGTDPKFGRVIIQDNTISYNLVENTALGGKSIGGGMNFGMAIPTPPGEYIIRNNVFSYNRAIGSGFSRGGGMILIHLNFKCEYFFDDRPAPLVYNNIIHHNEASSNGGGVAARQTLVGPCYSTNYATVRQPVLFNNTIVDNMAPKAAGVYCNKSATLLYNNILWNNLDAYVGSKEIEVSYPWEFFIAEYNLIQGGWGSCKGLNWNADPSFMADSYELSEGSPCIGRGVDSVFVDRRWYTSAGFDYIYGKRPEATDGFRDIGAFESPYNCETTPMSFVVPNPGVQEGEPLVANSSKPGALVLVPVNTPANHDSIAGSELKATGMCADQSAELPTDGLTPGQYWLYAIAANLEISEPEPVSVNPVGIQDVQTSSVQIYPVPVRDYLQIKSNQPVSSVEIFNASGRRIMQYGQVESPINVAHLEQGVYYVRIMLENGRICSRKLMKN